MGGDVTRARRVPCPRTGIDLTKLPLSTLEGFVLSRADGAATVEDIAVMVGVELEKLLAMLERLAELGAVELPWVPTRPGRPVAASETLYDNPSQPPAYDRGELDAPGDLDPLAKRRILNAYYSLEGRTFYELLGVPRDADKAAVRAAYFELSKRFHPDAFFGKEIGVFRSKTEAVFKRLTEAYEVLGRKKRRREYDDYLAVTRRTNSTQRAMRAASVQAIELRGSMEPERLAFGGASVEDAPAAEAPSVPRAPRLPREVKARRPAPSVAVRRERAAKRLRRHLTSIAPSRRLESGAGAGGEPAPAEPRASEPGSSQRARRDSAIDGLRRSLGDSARVAGAGARLARYVTMARQAEASGDVLSAVNALQLALALAEDDPQLQADYERLSQAISDDLASNFEKQAMYEEKVGNWAAAARSRRRVADSRPIDAEAARAVAHALLRSNGDLHQAKTYAERAIELDRGSPDNVVMLARVLLAAGLKLNAQRELEKALNLDPQHEMAKNLLGEVK